MGTGSTPLSAKSVGLRSAALAALVILAVITSYAQIGGTIISAIIVAVCVVLAPMVLVSALKKEADHQLSLDHAALEERLGYRIDLLKIMTSSEPRALIVSDRWERILYANDEAAKRAGRNNEELIGATLGTVLGEDAAKRAKERMQAAFKARLPISEVDRDQNSMIPRVIQTNYIPVPNSEYIRDAIFITETDITNLVAEREQREKMFKQLLDVCIQVADRRDPHASGHSELVGELARNLASHLKLPHDLVDTAEIAGQLMNFGKVLVPPEILTKQGALTADELQLVRDCMLTSADVLSVVQFNGPVVQTLRQVHEHVDGSGMPEHRKGDDILITARICAVANAFIALISTRSYRPGLDLNAAYEVIAKQIGKTYDRKVVDALQAYLQQSNMFARLAKIQARAVQA